jgi:electron transport complex protein RnfB
MTYAVNRIDVIEAIDALLPQTQCGKCGHPGCWPYAEGIAAGEAINKCPPGGQNTVNLLGALLEIPAEPLAEPEVPAQIAFIREAECIGCTKCIKACPTDAILGAAKLMHTVIRNECTGCELCVAPCPVDCIDILPLAEAEAAQQRQRADQFRSRFQKRNARLLLQETRRQAERKARMSRAATDTASSSGQTPQALPIDGRTDTKRLKIEAAMARMALTKAEKQFAQHGTDVLRLQVETLRAASDAAEQALSEGITQMPSGDADTIKKAKISSAMSRAQLSKAEKAFGASPSGDQLHQLEVLRQAAAQAQAQLDALQAG